MFTIWLVLLIAFAVLEIATVGLFSIWFCFGALIAMILASFNAPVIVQISVFFAVSIALMAVMIPFLRKSVNPKSIRTNADRVIDQIGLVLEEINNEEAKGLVRVDGKEWTARSKNGEIIPAGEKVGIISIEGVKVIVQKLSDQNNIVE